MRLAASLIATLMVLPAHAKLPPPSEEAKAQAAELASKNAWTDKIGAYQTCLAQDRVADFYRKSQASSGRMIVTPSSNAPCVDPGPYVSKVTPPENKPLEASEAHSPPGLAVSPPSTKSTAAEIAGGIKKETKN